MMPRAFQTPQARAKDNEEKSNEVGDDENGIGEETQELLSSYQDVESVGAGDSQTTLMDSRGLEETQVDEETQMA